MTTDSGDTRECKECQCAKATAEFYKGRSVCKGCISSKQAKYYADKGRLLREQKKATDPAARQDAVKKYNASQKAAAARIRHRNSSQGRAKAKAYDQLDTTRVRRGIRQKERRVTDRSYKLRRDLSRAVRLGMTRYGCGHAKAGLLLDLIGCSIPEYISHIEKQWRPDMTWDNHGQGKGTWQIDHIRPLASFDLTDPQQQKVAFHYTNQQPLWWKENLEKSDFLPDGSRGRHLMKSGM